MDRIDIFKEELNQSEKMWAKRWVERYTNLLLSLTNPYDFSKTNLRKLIIYEATHYQRHGLLKRLMGRYYKLAREEEYENLLLDMKRYNNVNIQIREKGK